MVREPEITLGDLMKGPTHVMKSVVEENYRKMIEYSVRRFRMLSLSDAEDIVQQVFLELWKMIDEGIRNPDIPVCSWLFGRLRQRCLNYIRNRQRQLGDTNHPWVETESENSWGSIPHPGVAPDEGMEQQELIEFLQDCIDNHLQNRTQQVIRLVYVEGLSQREVAEQLGVTEARVAQLKRRGIALIRRRLEEAELVVD